MKSPKPISGPKSFSFFLVVLLLFFFVDEFAFVLYNISLFQYMCSNTLSLFVTDEIPIFYNICNANTLFSNENQYLIFNVESTCAVPFIFETFDSHLDLHVFESSKTYVITEPLYSKEQSSLHFYKIKMEATNVKKNLLSFYPLQNYVYTIPGESTLIFYRLENLTDHVMQSLSVYVTSPAEAVAYVKKLQCFCYEELMISPKCIIDLPILFSLDDELLNEDFKEITINYILLLKDKK